MGAVAQIAVYLLAVALPVAILVTLGIGFGWQVAMVTLFAPMAALALFGLLKASS
jgi:hypothetical protein